MSAEPLRTFGIRDRYIIGTPQPLYNTVRYNMVWGITRISVGPQFVILDLLSYITIHFTLVIIINTVWIANTEIGLDPNNSVIKRLRCTYM